MDAALAGPLCAALDTRLAMRLATDLGAVRGFLEAAEGASGRGRTRRLRQARVRLVAARARARRAARRHKIDPDCRDAIVARLDALRQVVGGLGSAPPLAPGLPRDIAGYPSWLRLNAAPIPPRAGFDAHGGTKQVYVNQARVTLAPGGQQLFPYPEGATVVKEAGQEFIRLVAVMRKRAGSDPAHNDWTFVEYARSKPGDAFSQVGSGALCWSCHGQPPPAGALATDYVFTALDPAP